MELKELGHTGIAIPEIGLGTWKYTGGVEPLRQGVELGASLIDTAEMYRNEDMVGQAIAGIRDKVFVATKVLGGHLKYNQVMRAAEQSLRLLGIDTIDLYQLHWPNSQVPIAETMRAMEELVDAGKVRYIGVSNFSVRELREAQAAMKKYPVVSNQVHYNLNRREIERELLPYCQEHGVTIIAYTPLASGSLVGKGPSFGRVADQLKGRGSGKAVLQQVAREAGKTPAQVALNWCTSHDNVVAIPKSNSIGRVEENCGASGWRLSLEQAQRLNEAFPL